MGVVLVQHVSDVAVTWRAVQWCVTSHSVWACPRVMAMLTTVCTRIRAGHQALGQGWILHHGRRVCASGVRRWPVNRSVCRDGVVRVTERTRRKPLGDGVQLAEVLARLYRMRRAGRHVATATTTCLGRAPRVNGTEPCGARGGWGAGVVADRPVWHQRRRQCTGWLCPCDRLKAWKPTVRSRA